MPRTAIFVSTDELFHLEEDHQKYDFYEEKEFRYTNSTLKRGKEITLSYVAIDLSELLNNRPPSFLHGWALTLSASAKYFSRKKRKRIKTLAKLAAAEARYQKIKDLYEVFDQDLPIHLEVQALCTRSPFLDDIINRRQERLKNISSLLTELKDGK